MAFSALAKFRPDTRGGVALMFGLITPVLIGFAGLGVDGAYWMKERNKLQSVTDSAAISATQSLALNSTDEAIRAEAKKILIKTYGTELTGVRHTVQHPPQSGAMAGDTSAVAVLTEKDQPIFFLSLFGIHNTYVTTRSVARVDNAAEACMLALSPDVDKAINIAGNTTVNLKCGIASNSNSPNSVYFSGSSDTVATGISAVGDIFQSNNALVSTNGGPQRSNTAAVTDPYGPQGRNLQVPDSPVKCTDKQLQVKADTTLTPGRYCGGIDMINGNVTFAPGTYIIDGGNFKANGGVTLAGENVTFVLTGKSNAIANLDINAGANVSLHAPKSGTAMDGVLFFQDPAESLGGHVGENYINGNASLNLSGAVYFPNQNITISGGTASDISCLQLVAQQIKITGNSKITGTCATTDGTEKITRAAVELVE